MHSADRGPRTVLVVDDEPDLCEIIQRMLSSHGYTVITALGVADAVTRAQTHPGTIDLLITDLRMPDGDGRMLATRIRDDRPETAVLYISGLLSPVSLAEDPAGSGATILAKPFTPAELLGAVRNSLPTV